MNRINGFTVALLAALFSTGVQAHHSSAVHYDATKPIEIHGVITQFKFVNPHAYVYLDVKDADGNVHNWNCEMTAATELRRNGWTMDVFSPGTAVDLKGIAARRDPYGCSFTSATLADGTTMVRNGKMTAGGPTPAALGEHKETQQDAMTIDGNWQTTPRKMPPPGVGHAGGTMDHFGPMLTQAGKAAAAGYDSRFDDPSFSCSPSSVIRVWAEPDGVSQITTMGDKIIIKHEFMDTVRTIHMNAGDLPKDIVPSLLGYSVGHFDNGTLVIETNHFKAGVLLPHPGILNSDQMTVLEKVSLSKDGEQLIHEYTVTDPKFLKEPITGKDSWTRTDLALAKYNCTELSGLTKKRPANTETTH